MGIVTSSCTWYSQDVWSCALWLMQKKSPEAGAESDSIRRTALTGAQGFGVLDFLQQPDDSNRLFPTCFSYLSAFGVAVSPGWREVSWAAGTLPIATSFCVISDISQPALQLTACRSALHTHHAGWKLLCSSPGRPTSTHFRASDASGLMVQNPVPGSKMPCFLSQGAVS